MRYLIRFTAGDVCAVAEIGEENLRKYLKALAKAGFIRTDRPKRNGHSMGHVVWMLTRDTGPRQPVVRKDGSGVWDQNTRKLWCDGKEVTGHDRATGLDTSPGAGL
jgi:hypothetical protein